MIRPHLLVALLGCSFMAGAAESDFLSRVRQLTLDGARAGEGYFSPDGRYMVFQSEREPDNPFYQIYRLDLETGDTIRVSNGIGKTTCPFIHPQTGRVLLASTHEDPEARSKQAAEIEFRASGQERRYAWDYDPWMDLYLVDPGSGETTALTRAMGYDAEGSLSPDGEWVVFTSNRQAFERPLSDVEQRQLEVDPAYFADLYRIRIDGTDLQRLTDVPGYDGGPFFFPDGSRIIWRRFQPDGLIADIWTALPDGSDARAITDFESMSWAPYVHPSGEYVFFASNKHGFGNFELFIVDVEGRKEPVRITDTDGFDGLPVPTPDGNRLTWTSNRHGRGGAQIYIGNWHHAAALDALAASPDRTAP